MKEYERKIKAIFGPETGDQVLQAFNDAAEAAVDRRIRALKPTDSRSVKVGHIIAEILVWLVVLMVSSVAVSAVARLCIAILTR